MQYSKYNDPTQIVRDETSTAQALCKEKLKSNDYLKKKNIRYFYAATTMLPIITTIIVILIVRQYRKEISEIIADSTYQPQLTSISLTSAFITVYIFSLDISSVVFLIAKKHEYKDISINVAISLHWAYITLIIEILVLLIVFPLPIKRMFCYCRYYSISLNTKQNYYLKSNRFKLLIVAVAVIFVSAHVNYILAAWLTEPSKTTSVAILALALIFLLYIMNKFLYSFAKARMEFINEYWRKELCTLCITIVGAIVGVTVICIEVAAFYVLPLPAVNLADYLENILQVSIVLVTALITYKIFDKDSDATIFLKKFNQHFKQDADLSEDPDELIAVIEAKVTSNNIKNGIIIKLSDPTLKLVTPTCKEYVVPVSEVKLYLDNYATQKISYINLAKAKIKVRLYDSKQIFKVSLNEAHLKMNHEVYELSKHKIKLIRVKEPDSQLHTSLISSVPALEEVDIDDQTMTISAKSKCCLSEVNYNGTCRYVFDSTMTIKCGDSARHLLLPDNPKMEVFYKDYEHYLQISGIKYLDKSLSNVLSLKIGKQNQFKLNIKNSEINLYKSNSNDNFFTIVCHHAERLTIPSGLAGGRQHTQSEPTSSSSSAAVDRHPAQSEPTSSSGSATVDRQPAQSEPTSSSSSATVDRQPAQSEPTSSSSSATVDRQPAQSEPTSSSSSAVVDRQPAQSELTSSPSSTTVNREPGESEPTFSLSSAAVDWQPAESESTSSPSSAAGGMQLAPSGPTSSSSSAAGNRQHALSGPTTFSKQPVQSGITISSSSAAGDRQRAQSGPISSSSAAGYRQRTQSGPTISSSSPTGDRQPAHSGPTTFSDSARCRQRTQSGPATTAGGRQPAQSRQTTSSGLAGGRQRAYSDSAADSRQPSEQKIKLVLGKNSNGSKLFLGDQNENGIDILFEYIFLQATSNALVTLHNPNGQQFETVKLPSKITIQGCENPRFVFSSHKVYTAFKEESVTMKFGDNEPSVICYTGAWNNTTHVDLPLSIENNCCEDKAYLHFH